MINRVQVLWYLNKDDLENYCLDFKPYKSHKLEGYEICEVDEDLIFDLCDRDPDRLQPVDYFKNRTEVENYLTDYITYFDDIIPDKGLLEISEWNNILDEVYKKNKLYLGLYRAV